MRLKEFEMKYGTGEKCPVDGVLANGYNKGQVVQIPGEKFEANLGDMIKDYHKHLSMGPIRRFFTGLSKWEWDSVENKFRKALNMFSYTWSDTTVTK